MKCTMCCVCMVDSKDCEVNQEQLVEHSKLFGKEEYVVVECPEFKSLHGEHNGEH